MAPQKSVHPGGLGHFWGDLGSLHPHPVRDVHFERYIPDRVWVQTFNIPQKRPRPRDVDFLKS